MLAQEKNGSKFIKNWIFGDPKLYGRIIKKKKIE